MKSFAAKIQVSGERGGKWREKMEMISGDFIVVGFGVSSDSGEGKWVKNWT